MTKNEIQDKLKGVFAPVKRVTFARLKEMNDVEKNDYINMILNEDKKIGELVERTQKKVEVTVSDVVELEMAIDDVQ